MERKILNGWKEISGYMQRGVRTAQRWEAYLGMPVHRPAGKDRSAVVAFSDELDSWLVRADPNGGAHEMSEALARMHKNMSSLASHVTKLASESHALQERLGRSLRDHHHRIALRAGSRCATAATSTQDGARGAMLPFRRRPAPGRELLLP